MSRPALATSSSWAWANRSATATPWPGLSAFSPIHARDAIMPVNRNYPLAELDSDSDARDLLRLLRGMPSKVNLIPFNP